MVPDLSIWQSFQRIGGGLTPQGLSSIIRQADGGDITRLIDAFNEFKQKDCHLQSILLTAEEAIAGLEWELVLPEDAKARDRRAADWIEDRLREGSGLHRLIAHHAGARAYGHSVSEINWVKVEGKLAPKQFEHIPQRRFAFRTSDGRLVWRDENMPQEGIDVQEVFPGKFIVSQPRVTGDVPCREGLIRVLLWAALFRNWTMSDWLKLGEIAWKPWRLGKYDKNASQEDIDNLVNILEGLTTNGVATYPEGTEVEIEWLQGGSSQGGKNGTHAELFSTIGGEMSKVVLGQTLTTEQGKVGSQALGNVQNEVRKDLREASARYVSADITRDLIEVMTRVNFGPAVKAARFRLITDDATDIVAFSTSIKNLSGKDVNLKIPSAWARDKIGAPEPKGDEECVGGVEPEPVAPIDPNTGKPAASANGTDKPAAGKPAAQEKPEADDE